MTLAVLLLLQSKARGENGSSSKHSNLWTLVTLFKSKLDKMACRYSQLWIDFFYRTVWCWNKCFIYLCFFWSFQKTQFQYAVSTIFSERDRFWWSKSNKWHKIKVLVTSQSTTERYYIKIYVMNYIDDDTFRERWVGPLLPPPWLWENPH